MRITDVRVHLVPFLVQPPFRWRAGLRVIADAGVEGPAMSSRGKILADLVDRRLRAELIGQAPCMAGRQGAGV